MLRHGAIRIALVLLPLAVSTSRLHAHTVSTPAAATQEINRCLTIVRVAASRRTAPAQRARTPKPSPRSRVIGTTDYRIPAGTPLTIRLRTGSVLHGKITEATAASKENPLGRLALQEAAVVGDSLTCEAAAARERSRHTSGARCTD